MITQWTLFVIVLFVNATIAFMLAVQLGLKRRVPGRNSMIAMLAGLVIWMFCYAVIAVVPTLEAKIFWLKVENIGILTVPVFWFLFTVQYARFDAWLNRYTGALFFIIPVLSLGLIFSEKWIYLYYSSIQPLPNGVGSLVVGRGPWYWAAVIQAYTIDLIGTGILIWRFVYYRSIYRRQLMVLVGAALIPLGVNAFYQFSSRIMPAFSLQVDLTPISFTITALFLSTGIFGLRLFDLIPIARHTVLEHIPEMVFVVDMHDRLLDANSAGQKALGKSLDEIVGHDPLEVFREWPQLINRFLTNDETRAEIQIPDDPPRTLELDISLLKNQLGQMEGRVIVAHDITDHKWLENDMKYANESLKNQLEEIEKLRAELEEQAIHDPLTNTYNRRYLSEFLEQVVARAEREKTPITVVILDLDNFKQFNDSYGHKCGDIVLQSISNFLVDHSRRSDVVCRYGGEEFVILMPQVSFEVGYERAEIWRQDFAESVLKYEDMELMATFSAGVATFPQHGSTGEALLQAADKALLRAKNTGKNKVAKAGVAAK